MLVYFVAVWNIIQPFSMFYGCLVYFVVIWLIFPRFGMLYQEQSGNPESDASKWKPRLRKKKKFSDKNSPLIKNFQIKTHR
jgi:hypothetical protein